MRTDATQPFHYRGYDFMCTAHPVDEATFQPRVLCLRGNDSVQQVELLQDSDAYGSLAEALRHAEQQAVRWVHDRTGDGQGRF
ncbi:hypothetical protein [Variovorax rhizosphaerae]|uniref:DUF1488 domain-containing protein n=1 Tax=Variovorax rhizosphaerae TaxID=1836200 RepID=A0ABU8WYW0_9BURK